MKIDFSPRCGGKTTRLIEWLREDKKRVMLTFNKQEKFRLQKQYEDVATQIFEWMEWRSKQSPFQRSGFPEIGIDNADLILSEVVASPIARITISDL